MFSGLTINKNFKYHWLAGGIAQTGNFFTIVALPWLVLALTDNNPLVMTSVMATTHFPQSVFILFGGVAADRVSPVRLLLVSRFSGAVLLLTLAACVYIQSIPLWLIYIYALLLGILGAINIPAGQSMLPSIVKPAQLEQANGIFMGTLHFAQLIGPFAAGWVIYLGRKMNHIPVDQIDYSSLALAFFVDAVGLFLSFLLLLNVDVQRVRTSTVKAITALNEGLSFCWKDKGIRLVLSYIVLISFFIHGPVYCSIPLIAKSKLLLDEAAFGTLSAMTSLGIILGAVIAMKLKPPGQLLGKLTLTCDLIAGFCLFAIANANNAFFIALMLVVMGTCSGTIMIAGTTWFQRRTPGVLMGRVMSVLMFCVMGLIPFSALLSGVIVEAYSVDILLRFCALFVISIATAGLLSPTIRNMGGIAGLMGEIND